LARLSKDKSLKIHKNITSLLRDIYFPLEKSSNDLDEHQAKKHKSNDGFNLLKGISDIIYVLEIIANTWDQLTSTLNKKSNKPLNEYILQAFNDDAITLMIKSIDSKDKYNLKEIIYKIASNVPSSKVLGFVAKVSDLINSSTEN